MRLICMAFDGEYVTEGRDFPDTEAAWERASDMGSRWYFYPWCFVTSDSGKTVVAAPDGLAFLKGKRVKTVVTLFKAMSEVPELANAGVEEFHLAIRSTGN